MKKIFSVILIVSFCFLLLSLIPTKNNNNEKINEEREKISLELVRKISNTKKIIVKNRNTNVVLKTIYGNLVEDVISILSLIQRMLIIFCRIILWNCMMMNY